jgi:hypothetical protein
VDSDPSSSDELRSQECSEERPITTGRRSARRKSFRFTILPSLIGILGGSTWYRQRALCLHVDLNNQEFGRSSLVTTRRPMMAPIKPNSMMPNEWLTCS